MGYDEKIEAEISTYKENTVVHDLPEIYHYLSNKHLKHLLKRDLGVNSFEELILEKINDLKMVKKEEDIEIISLGSGNCDFEINFVRNNNLKTKFSCLEINPHMLERGKESARKLNIESHFNFIESDINRLKISEKYDIVLANHSLHHFVELEHIFEEISNCMHNGSIFVINDMIGRNGHMFWDSTFEMVNRIWSILPKELKYNHQLKEYFPSRVQWDCSKDGFEGIRAQDILPLLDDHFSFTHLGTFFSLVNRFIDRDFGPNFRVDNKLHTSIIDMIWEYDDYCLRKKILKPTQIIAVMVKKDVGTKDLKFTYFKEANQIYKLSDEKVFEYFDKILPMKSTKIDRLKYRIIRLKKKIFYKIKNFK